jgi:glycosyltransferase involved in cell wall biosynthesis
MPEHPTVLQVGAKPNKNVPRLVEALAGLPCRLVLVGQPNAALAGQLAASGLEYEVHTEVPQAQMVEFYRQADAVAFASTHEGFGMPIVEAQSVGRPVVTADRSSMPEVAGEGACLVDPYDVASIRDAFVRIFADDDYRAALIARGFKNVTRFGTAAISRRYAELYGGLMEAAASPSRPAAGTS